MILLSIDSIKKLGTIELSAACDSKPLCSLSLIYIIWPLAGFVRACNKRAGKLCLLIIRGLVACPGGSVAALTLGLFFFL